MRKQIQNFLHAASLWIAAVVFPIPGVAYAEDLTLVQVVEKAATVGPAAELGRQGLAISRGTAEIAGGRFDWNLIGSAGYRLQRTPYTPEVERIDDIVSIQVGAAKTFGFGLKVEPSVELYRTASVIPAVVSGTVAPQNVAVVSLRVTQPILRGFGASTVAEEDALKLQAQAALYDFQHALSARVANASDGYWAYAGASKSVEIQIGAEKRSEQLLKEYSALVAADERPRADLEQLEASLADRGRARVESEQRMLELRAELAYQMGLEGETIAAVGAPSTPLPQPSGPIVLAAPEDLVQSALTARRDLLAAKERFNAAEIVVAAADNAGLPFLDLVGELGYAGITEGDAVGQFFQPLFKTPGLNAAIALNLRWPVADSQASGELKRAIASRRRAEIDRDDVIRRIKAGVPVALEGLRRAREALERAQKAAVHHRASVDNERTKLKSGLATIIDVILTEDRMNAANLAEISARAAYARACARLAFEVGALTRPKDDTAEIDVSLLTEPVKAAR